MRPQIFRQFSDDFFSRHPQKRPLLVLTLEQIHLYERLYLAISNMALPLHRQIMPFTVNRAFSGPCYPLIGPFYPRGPPGRWVRGWSGPALFDGHFNGAEYSNSQISENLHGSNCESQH